VWLPWQTATQLAVALTALLTVARATRLGERVRIVEPITTTLHEVTLVLVLYALWQYVGDLAITKVAGADRHARWIVDVERTLHLPSELRLQRALLPHHLAIQFLNVFYAVAHVPAVGVLLLWLFFRHRDRYAAIRNALALTTAGCLLIQMVPVAPPRFLPDLGYVDAGLRYHQSVYGTGGSGISNQLAAMPSLHVGWSVLVAFGVVTVSRSRWRWLVIVHPLLTIVAVVATGNHWWLDGIVAVMVLAVAVGLQRAGELLVARVRRTVVVRQAPVS
jgi:hypothetical protein